MAALHPPRRDRPAPPAPRNVWAGAAGLGRGGAAGALATVARTAGSGPVPAGTKMLVGGEGRLHGSVGGGCVEADVIQAALDAQAAGVPALVTHHLNADLAGDLGLSCGGTVEIFVEPLVANPRYVGALEQAGAAEGGGIVTTAVSWADGPFKRFEPLPPGAAATGAPAALSPDRRFVIERLTLAPRVGVFGAGHVGTAIARAADAAGVRLVVVDDRLGVAHPARGPDRLSALGA